MKYLKPLTLFEESVKNYSVLFGLSVCDKHVGLAISNEIKPAAFPYLYCPRDENFLDTLVNRIEGYISKDSGDLGHELDLDGIIVGKNHVGFIDEMCKTDKLKDLKYTYWEDNIASKRAEHKSKVPRDIFVRCQPPPTVDMFSSIYMLQGVWIFLTPFYTKVIPFYAQDYSTILIPKTKGILNEWCWILPICIFIDACRWIQINE